MLCAESPRSRFDAEGLPDSVRLLPFLVGGDKPPVSQEPPGSGDLLGSFCLLDGEPLLPLAPLRV